MAKKTNKTSHILDLLTNGPAPETKDSGSSQSRTAIPKKVTVVDEGSRSERLSQDISNKLSEELAQETGQNAALADAPAQNPAPAEAPVQNTVPEPVQNAAPKQNPPQTETIELESLDAVMDEDEKALFNTLEEEDEEEFRFVNVMEQLLMKQNLDSVLKKYGVCTCKRCSTDVRALTLTSLPSKYVVIGQNSFSPVLNFYENKYAIEMQIALSKACSRVRQTPHHKRSS